MNDQFTIFKARIKRKNKRLYKELWQAFIMFVFAALFFGGCWAVDRWIHD